jgi:hypothetical protein
MKSAADVRSTVSASFSWTSQRLDDDTDGDQHAYTPASSPVVEPNGLLPSTACLTHRLVVETELAFGACQHA